MVPMHSSHAPLAGLQKRAAHLLHSRSTFLVIALAIAVYGFALRWAGMVRSLWLDEAWVANSVTAPTLRGMFYYDTWLQSTPPLFLLLVRTGVSLLGSSNVAFRAVPMLMGVIAAVSMLAVCMRLFTRPLALLGWSLFMLSPIAISSSAILKQYGSESAITAVLLWISVAYITNPRKRTFWFLLAAAVAGIGVGYGSALLLPGLTFMLLMTPLAPSPAGTKRLWRGPLARACLFASVTATGLCGEYYFFVIPNSPAALREYWSLSRLGFTCFGRLIYDASNFFWELPLNVWFHRFPGLVLLGGSACLILAGLTAGYLRFREGRPKWLLTHLVCLTPCMLLFPCDLYTWYPFSLRTSFFALPCLIVLLISSLQLAGIFLLRGRLGWRPAASLLAFGTLLVVLANQRSSFTDLQQPEEDMQGAVAFLKDHVKPRDFLWVHSSAAEAFKLYSRVDAWRPPAMRYGNTGWPCCPRGWTLSAATPSESRVKADFGTAILEHLSAPVWLLYTLREEQWKDGVNEPQVMKTMLRENGCVQQHLRSFRNIGVDQFVCPADQRAAIHLSDSQPPALSAIRAAPPRLR